MPEIFRDEVITVQGSKWVVLTFNISNVLSADVLCLYNGI